MEKFKLINGWTKEKVMEQVKKYNNNNPSKNEKGACVYLASDGNRCAVGCFIPDGHPANYSSSGAEDLLVRFPSLREVMPFDTSDGVSAYFTSDGGLAYFQAAHDNASNGQVHAKIQKFLDDCVEE